MKAKIIIKYLGFVLLFNAIFLFISAGISLYLHETSFVPLLFSAFMCTILGTLPQVFVETPDEVSFHEGLSISVLGWIITCLIGTIPYFLWGGEFSLANAIFESVSGFTTTGSTILNDIEVLPKGLLFWRASTHFIGGAGIILFVLLILPDKRGIQSSIYHSEVSGLSMMNFKTKTKEIGNIIVIVYCSLVLLETVLLKLLGMEWFDAICHSFATVATGGFSTKNLSIAYYNNIWIEITIMFFMILSSIHFGLIYATILGKKFNIFTSKITRTYIIAIFIGILLVALQLTHEHVYDFNNSLRYASFQVISLATTTGFATADTPNWPIFSILILIYYTIQCGMVGSTSGGLKFDRVYLFFQSLIKQLKLAKHPNGVYAVKVDEITISNEVELQTVVFILLYILTFSVVALLLTAMNIDGITSFSASIATIGNVGPGFGGVSSLGNYAGLPDTAKYLLSINMLLGRLEIVNVIVFLTIITRRK